MAAEEQIRNAIKFWETIYEAGEGTVRFIKKSGNARTMNCTLDFSKIPQQHHPKSVNMAKILKLMQKNGIIHVYDLDKKDWRSIPFEKVDWLETANKRYKIVPYKR
jgi:hypothetical protein